MLCCIVCRSPRDTTASIGSDSSPQVSARLQEPSPRDTESGNVSHTSSGLSLRSPEETSPRPPAPSSGQSPPCQADTSPRPPARASPGSSGFQIETSPRMAAVSGPGCSGRSPPCPGETSPRLPAGSSASAPCTVGRMATYQPSCPPHSSSIDLNVVLSDVTEEDTDLEDGHISPVSWLELIPEELRTRCQGGARNQFKENDAPDSEVAFCDHFGVAHKR